MKNKLKSKLIVLMVCLASLFVLGGCSLGESMDEILSIRNLTAQVTYYSNGGTFDGDPNVKEMYYKSGSKALNISEKNQTTNGTAQINRTNYEFGGWYYAVLDENGEPVVDHKDEKGNLFYVLGEPVDFSVPLKEGDHWILVAKWKAKVGVEIRLSHMDDKEAVLTEMLPADSPEGAKPNTYKHGQPMGSVIPFDDMTNQVTIDDGDAPIELANTDYTFIDYYADEACTTRVDWPLAWQDGQETNTVVYAKYVKGNYTVLRSSMDVSTMFYDTSAGKKYWLVKDIDATGITVSPIENFACEIQGNGHTIKNLKVKKTGLKAGSTTSLFGNVQDTAIIKNLSLEGIGMWYKPQGISEGSISLKVYFAFSKLSEKAVVEGVKLSGEIIIGKGDEHKIENMSENNFNSFLYGGFSSDAEYLTKTEEKGFNVSMDKDPATYVKFYSANDFDRLELGLLLN